MGNGKEKVVNYFVNKIVHLIFDKKRRKRLVIRAAIFLFIVFPIWNHWRQDALW